MRESQGHVFQRACLIGNYTPRQCGIATFTADLSTAIREHGVLADIVALNDRGKEYDYPAEVIYQIPEAKACAYRAAADYLNFNDYSVACLQHEYGIFGGPAGSHILQLLRNLRMPLVTTLHTILESPSDDQRNVLEEIVQLSQRVVVMSRRAKSMLQSQFGIDSDRIDLVAHGSLDVNLCSPDSIKPSLGFAKRKVLLTFGLLSPDKGIEYVIQALPALVKRHPDLLYVVLGATHPQVRANTNDSYRKSLVALAKTLGVEDNIQFEDRFVEKEELAVYLQAADIYVTPYLKPHQITSGTLSFAFGCGKPIISTPYWHASELLEDDNGILVPFRDSAAIEESVGDLLDNPTKLIQMSERAYALGRPMTWHNTGKLYLDSFVQAIEDGKAQLRSFNNLPTLTRTAIERPRVDVRHMATLTDDTGILQHASGPIPNRNEGYCVDDNARALLVCARLSRLGMLTGPVEQMANTYLSYLQHAWSPSTGRFRNFMAYNRTWLDDVGSEDSHGRAVWGLGEWTASNIRSDLRRVGLLMLEKALPEIKSFTSPRAWAYSILGLSHDESPLVGESFSRELMRDLATRLADHYEHNRKPNWNWFEVYASYDNARLCEAMLVAGRALEDRRFIEIGLESLEWLCDNQVGENGVFAPIGSDEVWYRGKIKPIHDQQPLEAWAIVDACVIAAALSDSPKVWTERAKWAMDWFLGVNERSIPLIDLRTGGCADGLQEDRVSDNQGAESTLAYIGAATKYLHFIQSQNWNHARVA
ncbi:MAG: glycosyltransferase family 4 protein [Chlorobia bacterium]|nr:glycosyltransferase family 4 protein [Fimbriimonadaceae bacterium]